jgi:hypothetical protein
MNMMKTNNKYPAKEAIIMFYDENIKEYAEMAYNINDM